MEEKELFSTIDDYIINEICEILKQNEIPFIKKDDGSGSYMNIYMGKSIQTKRIIVNAENYNKAKELIGTIINNEQEEYIEEEEVVNSSKKVINKVAVLMITIPIIIGIVLFIISMFNNFNF